MQPPRVTGPDTVIEQLGTVLCHRMQRGERGWVVAGAEGLSCPCLVSISVRRITRWFILELQSGRVLP